MKKIFCEVDSFIARSIKWCDVLGAHSESIFPFTQHFISFQKTIIRVIDCWRDDDEFSWNNFYFIVVKEFLHGKNTGGFLENLTDYFLNIMVNVNFFGDLKFEYYWALPQNTATNKP